MDHQDFTHAMNNFEKIVHDVISGADQIQKDQLVKKLQHFLGMTKSSESKNSRKRLKSANTENALKKMDFDSRAKFLQHLPDEVWVKIMNYLPTTYVFNAFGHVCKRFHNLTYEIKYLKIRYIKEGNNWAKVTEIVKNCKSLIEFDIRFDDARRNVGALVELITKCDKLKSLKIDICALIDSQFNINHNVKFSNSLVMEEISKLNQLKTLDLYYYNFTAEFPAIELPLLEKLTLKSYGLLGDLSSSFLEKIMNISPNLKTIKLNANINLPTDASTTNDIRMYQIVKNHGNIDQINSKQASYINAITVEFDLKQTDSPMIGEKWTQRIRSLKIGQLYRASKS